MTKVNVGVIGCGFWGKNHVRVFNEIDNCNLLAVADIDSQQARLLGEQYRVKWHADPLKVIENPAIDFISICTPTTTHAALALDAVKAGKHILAEKPMTSTSDEAKQVIAAAHKANVYVMVGFIERFNPAVRYAEQMIKEQKIGTPVLASAKRVSRWPIRIGDVGVVKDLAIHDIDLICHIFQNQVTQVFASAGSLMHTHEDYANVMMQFQGGKSAFIEANWLTPRKIRRLIITGTEGIIQVEYITQKVIVENQEMMTTPFFPNAEPLKLELEHFITSLVKDQPPAPNGKDGLHALTICEAVLHSAKHQIPVNPSQTT
jgi:UDP-N-acetylglucosamine 3-dehydrogenase